MPADEIAAAARVLVQHFMLMFAFQSGRAFIGRVDALLTNRAPTAVNMAFWRTGIGFHHWWEGDLAAAETAFAESLQICDSHGIALPATRLYNLYGLALIACERGELSSAEALHTRARRYADFESGNDQYHDGLILMRIAAQRRDWHTAIASCRRIMRFAEEVGWPLLQRSSLISLAYLLMEVEDHSEALECLRLADELTGQYGTHPAQADIALLSGYCALRQANPVAWHARLAEAMWALKSGEDRVCLNQASKVARIAYAAALEHAIEPEYVTRIIRYYRLGAPDADVAVWPWPIKILTLGQFRILVNDETLAFARKMPKKPLQLLKALIALGGIDVPERELADSLWPEEGGDLAVSACETTLVRLRRLLRDPRAILQRGGNLTLNRETVWVDALALAPSCGQKALTGQSARQSLASVIALYRGDFLPHDTDEPWSISPRERFRACFVRTLAEVGRQREEEGRIEQAISLYRRGMETDPLAEDFHRGLMRCHGVRQEYAEALGVHLRLRKVLNTTLGIPPSPATERLASVLMEAAQRGGYSSKQGS
jgi:LuxR family transcriptional regulator, maltose regulon positive regulatory protein